MESLEEFYNYKFDGFPAHVNRIIGQFNIFRIEDRQTIETLLPPMCAGIFIK